MTPWSTLECITYVSYYTYTPHPNACYIANPSHRASISITCCHLYLRITFECKPTNAWIYIFKYANTVSRNVNVSETMNFDNQEYQQTLTKKPTPQQTVNEILILNFEAACETFLCISMSRQRGPVKSLRSHL